MKDKIHFNPNQSFFSLCVFKLTTIIILSISASIATVIIYNSYHELNLNLSYEGFNNLLTILKLPIGVAALLIPAIAILVANHRSEQTKAQMELTTHQISLSEDQLKNVQKNNNFSNHYKHSDEFEKYIDNYQKDKKEIALFLYPRELHSKIFPDSKKGDYSASHDFAKFIDAELFNFLEIAAGLSHQKYYRSSSNSLDIFYIRLSKYLNMNDDATLNTARRHNPEDPLELGFTYQELLKPIVFISTALVKALAFDEDHAHSSILLSIAEFNPEDLPQNTHTGFNFKEKIANTMKLKVNGPINSNQP